MEVDKEMAGKVIEQSGGVMEKAYDDLAHPSAKSIGNTVSLVPRTIGVWLSKWEKWVINGEESIRLTAQAVQEKASKIPEEKLVEPEPYVAVPAIQQLSYCYNSRELRELYANLLVSSMNIDTKGFVHPAFVDIIKALTPDEAKLLHEISKERERYGDLFPLIDVWVKTQNVKTDYPFYKNFTTLSSVCTAPNYIDLYMENLARLKIITINAHRAVPDRNRSMKLEYSPFLKSYMDKAEQQGYHVYTKWRSFYLTDFGKSFMNACISKS